jgi:diguanylate cyclase (GGDEF)-like protein
MDKLIFVAEANRQDREDLESALRRRGLKRLAFVQTDAEIYERVRQFQDQPERLGALIVSDAVSGCDIEALCQRLADFEEGVGIPVLVRSNALGERLRERFREPTYSVTTVAQATSFDDMAAMTVLALAAKSQRDLRQKQIDQLSEELSLQKITSTRLKQLVTQDELTGLLSRSSFVRNLKHEMERYRAFGHECALLYLDIDRFGLVNNIEGFEAGEELLVDIVNTWRVRLRHEHIAARLFGDEFCILLKNVTKELAVRVADSLRQAIDDRHFRVGANTYNLTVCIGIVMLSDAIDLGHPNAIIARGRQAISVAKRHGRNMVYCYSDSDVEVKRFNTDIQWVPVIRDALQENRFGLNFQPIMKVADGRISHYEVLVRLQGKDGAEVPPMEFIPSAERMGLMHKLDFWVLDKSIEYLADLSPQLYEMNLSINLSVGALHQPNLISFIQNKLEIFWVDPARLTFEITETAAVTNYHQIHEAINRLKALGCRFALDDFGAGFSSFEYIKRFPVDYLKIDGQFVRGLRHDPTDRVLVKAMVDIAKQLGKRVIAEYVDNPDTLGLLDQLGVDLVQGYLIGKPTKEIRVEDVSAVADRFGGRSLKLDPLVA